MSKNTLEIEIEAMRYLLSLTNEWEDAPAIGEVNWREFLDHMDNFIGGKS